MAASVQQRIAFGKRAGQQVRRIGAGFGYEGMELLEKLAALVPLPRVHLVRYGGYLAPHSSLRGAIFPTPRQQGMEDKETDTTSPLSRRAV
jgi:hypothetical protein